VGLAIRDEGICVLVISESRSAFGSENENGWKRISNGE